MRALLEFIAKYYHWFMLVALEVVSIVMLVSFNRYQGSVWVTTANAALARINAWEHQATQFIHLGQANADLARRNIILEQNIAFLSQQLDSLTHDSTITERLQAERTAGFDMMHAKIVTSSVMRRDNLLTINVGSADGVKPEMGVICGTGVVGIIHTTSEHFSIVMPLLNSHSSISCRLRKTGYFGFLRWDGKSPFFAILDDIPRHARFRVGDIVETSGFTSVFPRGIFVGKVAAIENSDDGLSYKLRIHLGIDFTRLQDVSVIRQTFQPEVHELESQADSTFAQTH